MENILQGFPNTSIYLHDLLVTGDTPDGSCFAKVADCWSPFETQQVQLYDAISRVPGTPGISQRNTA